MDLASCLGTVTLVQECLFVCVFVYLSHVVVGSS